MNGIKKIIAQKIAERYRSVDFKELNIAELLEYPPDDEFGDIAFACFRLAKLFRKAPAQIAADIAGNIEWSEVASKVTAVSGYVNFSLKRDEFCAAVVSEILGQQENYGRADIGRGKTVLIDYSSPNIAKPFHVGHLRSTVIGAALYRIFEFFGYNCIGINHLGDWGTQFGKLIVAYRLWGDKETIEGRKIKELLRLYVKFHDEAAQNPALEDRARECFALMEQGDASMLKIWKWFVEISLQEFQNVYDLLGVKFDSYAGESFYNDKMAAVISELKEKQLLVESDGAMVVDLSTDNMPPCLILKKDGSSLYATRDISAAIYRKKQYDFEKCLYVTGASQALHFNQWFKVIDLMGYDFGWSLIHVPFGLINFNGEKLSTRSGNVVLLEEILNEAVNRVREIMDKNAVDLPNKEETARQIGVGAVVFHDLSTNRIKDIAFSWDDALDFNGNTGPYVQYTHARACSILRRAGQADGVVIPEVSECNYEEFLLAKTLNLFKEKTLLAMQECEPSIITRYLLELSNVFNRFYNTHQVLVDSEKIRSFRVALVLAVKTVLKEGLQLIGLAAPEKM